MHVSAVAADELDHGDLLAAEGYVVLCNSRCRDYQTRYPVVLTTERAIRVFALVSQPLSQSFVLLCC